MPFVVTSCAFKIHRASGRWPMLVSIIRFSRHKFRTQYYYETCHFKNQASVALNLLVSLFVVSLRVVAETRHSPGEFQMT